MVWKNYPSHRWHVCKISLGNNKEILVAELWGVAESLKMVLKKNISRKARRITDFSNSQAAIKQLQGSKSKACQALKIQILKRARQLHTHGGELIVRWIPSHSGIEGNKRADKAAKRSRHRWKNPVELSISCKAEDYRNLKNYSWHQVRNGKKRERRSRKYYVPRLKVRIHPILGQAPKKYASRFFQLKLGHGAIGVLLEIIGG